MTAESWEALWKLDGPTLKAAGVETKDRRCVLLPHMSSVAVNLGVMCGCRYVLWCLEKFRQGEDPSDFAHPPKPKKKVRG